MKLGVSTQTPCASASLANMNHSDPEFSPPPPKQPLPPGKQPFGPMPDQDHPPIEPHHLPDDPLATPDAGDLGLSRWTPQALGDAALGARIPL